MSSNEAKDTLSKPQIERLKAMGKGLAVGRVLGNRVLVKTVVPFTELDEIEKKGLLYLPQGVKEKYTPRASTGIVVQVGDGVVSDLVDRQASYYGDPAPLPIIPGEMVMFSKYAGTEFVIDEEEGFRILEVPEILCTLIDTQSVVTPVKEEQRVIDPNADDDVPF